MKPLDCFKLQNGRERIIALGELLVDFVPENDEVYLDSPGKIIKTASGSSGIMACAVARLRQKAGFIGKIGVDPLSRFVYQTIRAQGVDLSRVVQSKEGQIGLAFIEYTPQGRNYQFYRKNSVGSGYSAADIDYEYIRECFAVHYSGMLLELSPDMRSACQEMVRSAREQGVIVSFDPNIRKEMIRDEEAGKRLRNAIATADVISPTLEEAEYLTGETQLSCILRKLHAMGPKLIAVTRDARGAVISCQGEVFEVDGIPVEAVDPTGAGDTFAAAMLVGLYRGYELREILQYANCAGALATSKRGVIGVALPTDQMVLQLMRDTY